MKGKSFQRFYESAFVLFLSLSLSLVPFPAIADFRVSKVVDGDTIRLGNGNYVRLLQISAPELNKGHCYAKESQSTLASLISGSKVKLEADPVTRNLDKFNRLLRYVFVKDRNLNLEMVKIGAASPWLYDRQRGKYAEKLIAAGEAAKARNLGLWAACPEARLDPMNELFTGFANVNSVTPSSSPTSESFVNAGSYCKESEKGEERLSKNGTKYTCKVSETENRLRWRK